MVQWEGPPSLADVDGYIISYSPTDESYCEGLPEGEVVVNGPETTQLEVAEMAAGVEYDVRVAAYNSIGTGPFSVPPARITIPQKGIYRKLAGFLVSLSNCHSLTHVMHEPGRISFVLNNFTEF